MTKAQIELQELFQRIIQSVESYGILLLDVDGTILTWNKGVATIHGYKSEEILGQHISIFYLPQDRQANLPSRLLNEALQNGVAKHIGRRIRRNGQMFWGSIEITAIKDKDGQVIGFTNLARELKDETDIGHFWFDTDGILHTKASSTPHTPQKIQEFRKMLASASGTERLCCVADVRDAIMVDAGDSFNRPNIVDLYKAVAFISNDPVDNSTQTVFDMIKERLPAKIFTSREQATKWIRQYL